mmetsp:Transcript_10197/g.25597  ORF Transcript_10197/g.25597 Transcript_10197/m.25597 type:complete len:122 (-) Transcript_10197:38-403(-)
MSFGLTHPWGTCTPSIWRERVDPVLAQADWSCSSASATAAMNVYPVTLHAAVNIIYPLRAAVNVIYPHAAVNVFYPATLHACSTCHAVLLPHLLENSEELCTPHALWVVAGSVHGGSDGKH